MERRYSLLVCWGVTPVLFWATYGIVGAYWATGFLAGVLAFSFTPVIFWGWLIYETINYLFFRSDNQEKCDKEVIK